MSSSCPFDTAIDKGCSYPDQYQWPILVGVPVYIARRDATFILLPRMDHPLSIHHRLSPSLEG